MKYNIKNLIEIDKNEVLRYLQYRDQNIDNDLLETIKNCINRTKEIINPRFIFRKYEIEKVNGEVCLKGANLILQSNDIYNLLSECNECILMCATLGLEIEREIRKLTYTDFLGIIIPLFVTVNPISL